MWKECIACLRTAAAGKWELADSRRELGSELAIDTAEQIRNIAGAPHSQSTRNPHPIRVIMENRFARSPRLITW